MMISIIYLFGYVISWIILTMVGAKHSNDHTFWDFCMTGLAMALLAFLWPGIAVCSILYPIYKRIK